MKDETSENRNNSIKNFSLKSNLMRFLTNKENLKNVNKKNKNYQNIFLEKNENETILKTAYNQNNLLEESTTNNEDSRNKEYIKVSKDNNYIYTVFKDKLKQNNKKTFDSYALPSIIIIIFALIIGYIIVININTYNLLDQKKNLSIFRSLGFQYSEISQSWFVQSLIQWIISIIIGVPCGVLLSKIYLKIVSSNRREFVYANGIKEICITVILLFLFIYIGHRKCMRNFKKMNIIEEVKDRE